MGFFVKKTEPKEIKIPQRIRNLDRVSLLQWFDNSIMSLGASFDKWRYHDGPIGEVDDALIALNNIWEELQGRVDAHN
jgi:hypothetical protein